MIEQDEQPKKSSCRCCHTLCFFSILLLIGIIVAYAIMGFVLPLCTAYAVLSRRVFSRVGLPVLDDTYHPPEMLANSFSRTSANSSVVANPDLPQRTSPGEGKMPSTTTFDSFHAANLHVAKTYAVDVLSHFLDHQHLAIELPFQTWKAQTANSFYLQALQTLAPGRFYPIAGTMLASLRYGQIAGWIDTTAGSGEKAAKNGRYNWVDGDFDYLVFIPRGTLNSFTEQLAKLLPSDLFQVELNATTLKIQTRHFDVGQPAEFPSAYKYSQIPGVRNSEWLLGRGPRGAGVQAAELYADISIAEVEMETQTGPGSEGEEVHIPKEIYVNDFHELSDWEERSEREQCDEDAPSEDEERPSRVHRKYVNGWMERVSRPAGAPVASVSRSAGAPVATTTTRLAPGDAPADPDVSIFDSAADKSPRSGKTGPSPQDSVEALGDGSRLSLSILPWDFHPLGRASWPGIGDGLNAAEQIKQARKNGCFEILDHSSAKTLRPSTELETKALLRHWTTLLLDGFSLPVPRRVLSEVTKWKSRNSKAPAEAFFAPLEGWLTTGLWLKSEAEYPLSAEEVGTIFETYSMQRLEEEGFQSLGNWAFTSELDDKGIAPRSLSTNLEKGAFYWDEEWWFASKPGTSRKAAQQKAMRAHFARWMADKKYKTAEQLWSEATAVEEAGATVVSASAPATVLPLRFFKDTGMGSVVPRRTTTRALGEEWLEDFQTRYDVPFGAKGTPYRAWKQWINSRMFDFGMQTKMVW